MKRRFFMLILGLLPLLCWGHKPSDSYLGLDIDAAGMHGRWDIALRDLEYAMGLDTDQDGSITWGELRARHAEIADYALARLVLSRGKEPCAPRVTAQRVDRHSDGAYSVLDFELECQPGATWAVDYRLFFDLDPSHRGLLRVSTANGTQFSVLSPQHPRFEFDLHDPADGQALISYWREGVWHIWRGYDHLLFLLALLLPGVLVREKDSYRAVESYQPALRHMVVIVTAFTVAHSITLGIASLSGVMLPARWVESAIAATVVLVAIHNLRPFIPGPPGAIAFALGLIHGLGFASALTALGLPGESRVLALFGFNLGVETGQLIIVAGFMPLAYRLRHGHFYQRMVLGLGSVVVAAFGFGWLLERALDVRFMSV